MLLDREVPGPVGWGGLRCRVEGPILIKKEIVSWELSDYFNCMEPTETT